jgi:hypothetical protein
MGIFMEGICHYRDCESFFLFCDSICIHARQFYNSLDPNCYRIYMLLGCFDYAPTYSSTSALTSTAGYLEDIQNNMLPHTRIDIPIPIIIEPLIVQPGLLYMNEEDGPMMDLLCSVNIIPRIVSIMPMIINDLLARLFRFINYRYNYCL